MHPLRELLKGLQKPRKSVTNRYWLRAEEIAKATNTKPQRWLREVKNHWSATERALIAIREIQNIRNPAAYFTTLLKTYKQEESK